MSNLKTKIINVCVKCEQELQFLGDFPSGQFADVDILVCVTAGCSRYGFVVTDKKMFQVVLQKGGEGDVREN